ncbi:hypothetical protein CK203_051521 [Vitis vinifera]|uniref:DUF4283 domain-containing protein n=1 Tax=Vitis vinifera TaxID=29760 RepID=A0A438GDD3_VITVI|nr:hypothetical protein CK203_051521 [Vitis vinifera]
MELGSHGEIGGKEELGEAIWIQFGREDLKINVEHLKHCLVGSWGDPAVEGGTLILFDFGNDYDAKRVWCMGICSFEGKRLQLEWRSPEAGCYKERACVKAFWIQQRDTIYSGLEF